jgi:hypothetical protein
MPKTPDFDPGAALQAMQLANREMAERAKAPGWYHAALGLLMGGLAASWELPIPYNLAYLPVCFGGMALLVMAYRRKTGMWINGYRAGRTRRVALLFLIVCLAVMYAGMGLKLGLKIDGAPLVAGVIVAAITTWAGYAWERAYRRDLGVEGA